MLADDQCRCGGVHDSRQLLPLSLCLGCSRWQCRNTGTPDTPRYITPPATLAYDKGDARVECSQRLEA